MASLDNESLGIAKLDALKEIRNRTVQYEKLKSRLKVEIEMTENEDRCLAEYKKEMECLHQEKMAHVEELRQIHADINAMEQVIKQADEEKNRHLDVARSLNMEFNVLKESIDKMRAEIELPRLPELHEEDEKFRPEFFEKQQKLHLHDNQSWHSANPSSGLDLHPSDTHSVAAQQQAANVQQIQHFAAMAAAQRAVGRPPNLSVHGHNPGGPPQGVVPANPVERPMASSFRQQPPPMKSCLSCHQQIHRNAPICPLCKAKSRSRNPKKPKRKMED